MGRMHERSFQYCAVINERIAQMLHKEACPEDSRSSKEDYLIQLGHYGFPEQVILILYHIHKSLLRSVVCQVQECQVVNKEDRVSDFTLASGRRQNFI